MKNLNKKFRKIISKITSAEITPSSVELEIEDGEGYFSSKDGFVYMSEENGETYIEFDFNAKQFCKFHLGDYETPGEWCCGEVEVEVDLKRIIYNGEIVVFTRNKERIIEKSIINQISFE